MAASGDAYAAARERTARARELVAAGAYLATAGAVLVYSDRPGVAGYTVEAGRCPCPDATMGEAARLLGGKCKHSMVSEMVLRPAPRRLPPTDEDAWLDAEDDRAARRLEEIAQEFDCA